MEPRPPRRKKYCKSKPGCSLPIIETITGPYKFSGAFDGHSIVVDKQSEMEKINSMGCFGKGTLSRNFPSYNKIQMPILRVRQHEAYNALVNEKGSIKNIVEKHTLIVDDSDVDDELYFENLKPLVKKLKLPFAEVLRLSLEEAYYLMCKDCMKINDLNGVSLTKESAWTLFSKQQKTFIHNYIVYNYFRRRDWVVKSGLKFGGDFCMYLFNLLHM